MVFQAPILAIPTCLLQNAFRGEVKRRALFVRGVDPVNGVLPVFILIIAKTILIVPHVQPEFTNCPGRQALLAVEPHVLRAIAFDEVEAPSIETHIQT